jgi:hypothetical protein
MSMMQPAEDSLGNRSVITQSDVWKSREPAEPRKDRKSSAADSIEAGPCGAELPRIVKKLSRAVSPYIHNISVNGSIALSSG